MGGREFQNPDCQHDGLTAFGCPKCILYRREQNERLKDCTHDRIEGGDYKYYRDGGRKPFSLWCENCGIKVADWNKKEMKWDYRVKGVVRQVGAF